MFVKHLHCLNHQIFVDENGNNETCLDWVHSRLYDIIDELKDEIKKEIECELDKYVNDDLEPSLNNFINVIDIQRNDLDYIEEILNANGQDIVKNSFGIDINLFEFTFYDKINNTNIYLGSNSILKYNQLEEDYDVFVEVKFFDLFNLNLDYDELDNLNKKYFNNIPYSISGFNDIFLKILSKVSFECIDESLYRGLFSALNNSTQYFELPFEDALKIDFLSIFHFENLLFQSNQNSFLILPHFE